MGTSSPTQPTLGAGRLERVYPEHKLKLEIHDTSGQEKYRAIVPLYTKFADWIIYAFDLTSKLQLMQDLRPLTGLRPTGSPICRGTPLEAL
jgi:GTPase SAR1 family protein